MPQAGQDLLPGDLYFILALSSRTEPCINACIQCRRNAVQDGRDTIERCSHGT